MNTYNIHFNDSDNSNDLGFSLPLDEAKKYVAAHNGTDHDYFKDYKGGTVSIVCNETGETVLEEEII